MTEIELIIDDPESVLSTESPQPLPSNIYVVGDPQPGEEKIYIKQNVYHSLHAYSKKDTSIEVGSILVGKETSFEGDHHLMIEGYIDAKYVDSSESTLTFTHKTWEAIHKEKEISYKNHKIVGWHHTHPNYGIFLSRYDLFIQENYFNLPWQIAYVIDPINQKEGFFAWKNEAITQLTGFYIYDDIGKTIEIEHSREKKQPAKVVNVFNLVLLFLLFVSIAFGLSIAEEKKMLEEELERVITASIEIPIQDTQPPSASNTNSDLNIVSFLEYTIQNGDTLESICNKHSIGYEQNIELILKYNSILNPDIIYAGENLILPLD